MSVTTSDGEILKYYWRSPQEGMPSIIVFHGNGDAAVRQTYKANALAKAGFGVLLGEYRGYGESSGSPSETGLKVDGQAMYDFVRQRTDAPIGLYAHSLGTGVAVKLATQRDVFAIVLESAFDSHLAVAQKAIKWLPMDLLLKHPFRSDLITGEINVPILMMHGTLDRVVGIKHGKILITAAPAGTRFLEIAGAGHNDLINFGSVERAIGFFTKVGVTTQN